MKPRIRRVGQFYPPGGHDFIETLPIRQLQKRNLSQLDANQRAEATTFRVQALLKLAQHRAVGRNRVGWAMFFRPPESDEGAVMSSGNESCQTVLVNQRNASGSLLTTRIVRYEFLSPDFENPHGAFFVHDVAVDSNANTYYHVDGIPLGPDQKVPLGSAYFSDDEETGITPSVSTGSLPIQGFVPPSDPNTRKPVAPFGPHNNLFDRIYATDQAFLFLRELVDLEPIAQMRLTK